MVAVEVQVNDGETSKKSGNITKANNLMTSFFKKHHLMNTSNGVVTETSIPGYADASSCPSPLPTCCEDVIGLIDRHNIKYLSLVIADIYGISCEKMVKAKHFTEIAAKGLNIFFGLQYFDTVGAMPKGTGCTNQQTLSDGLLFPVYNTFRFVPEQFETARIICEMSYSSRPIAWDGKLLFTHDSKTEEFYKGISNPASFVLNANSEVFAGLEASEGKRGDHEECKIDSKKDKKPKLFMEPTIRLTSAIDPRAIARAMMMNLNELGFSLLVGFEFEFTLISNEDLNGHAYGAAGTTVDSLSKIEQGAFSTFARSKDSNKHQHILREIADHLQTYGVDVVTLQSEYGLHQFEVTFKPKRDIAALDDAFTFRNAVKHIAGNLGYKASFMAKPFESHCGSSCHINQSLWTSDMRAEKGSRNFTIDPTVVELDTCSQNSATHFLAGQMEHLPALTALLCPDVNSYKRLRPFNFAPNTISWGFENRTCAVRVKGCRTADDGHQEATEGDCYWENRVGSASVNPYLAYAALVSAGLDGIKRELPLTGCMLHDAYMDSTLPKLPQTLAASLQALDKDEKLKLDLGEPCIKAYSALKQHEVDRVKTYTDEVRFYFDYL